MMFKSDRPLSETVKNLMQLQDISLRELGRRTKSRYGWGSIGTLSRLCNGQLTPTPTAMENLAGALEVSPEVFAEYRLWREREKLDPEAVDLATALQRLGEIEGLATEEEPARHSARTGIHPADDAEQAESA